MSARAMAQFQTEAQARDAYFGDDGTGTTGTTGTPDAGAGWHEPEDIDILEGNWYLLVQEQIEGEATRYFVLIGPDPTVTQAMRRGGGTVEVGPEDTFDDLPSMETEEEAREAHARWLEEHGDDLAEQEPPEGNEETQDDEGHMWSAWEVVEEVPPWYVFGRVREDGERAEFLIAGVDHDGNEVYLHPRADIEDEPWIYTAFGDVEDALEAYFDAVENGRIPEDEQPTGGAPNPDNIGRAAGLPGGPAGTPTQRGKSGQRLLGRMIRFVGRNPRLILAVIVIGFLVHRHMAPGDNPIDSALGRLRGGLGGPNVEV